MFVSASLAGIIYIYIFKFIYIYYIIYIHTFHALKLFKHSFLDYIFCYLHLYLCSVRLTIRHDHRSVTNQDLWSATNQYRWPVTN